jgi:stage II sporulation protein D
MSAMKMGGVVAVAVGVFVSCMAPVTSAPGPGGPSRAGVRLPEVIRVRVSGRITAVPLEEYVLGSALSEVSPVNEPPSTVERIFEVQSVLARTYAAAHIGRHRAEGFDLCDTTHCQLYEPGRLTTSRFTPIARRAVEATAGRVLVFDGRPIDALFHSDCGGHTASADDVWGGPHVPYLVGAPDLPTVSHHAWQFDVSEPRLRKVLNADTRTTAGRSVRAIRVLERDTSGRAAAIGIEGDSLRRVRGEDLRAIVNAAFGPRALQSTRFTVSRSGATYRFEGTRYGHGVGLCQVGAAARARLGESTDAILAAYFPGATLQPGLARR